MSQKLCPVHTIFRTSFLDRCSPARLQENNHPALLQPGEVNQLILQCPRTDPLNPLHLIYNSQNNNKTREMSQSHAGENSYPFNNYSFNNNSFNNVYNVKSFSGVDERAEILAWLSPLEPRIRHEDIRAQRVEDVGDWLLRTEEYRNWFDGTGGGESDNSALFCYGSPGVGKTYMR